ncbi:DUF6049 family protein [Parafrigoribacterium soli]|uniref:DUF6049 family protein n=1 Tax=Parafrigoribacterium soli TaxID=3144663 RepID=UPI0032EBAAC6
MPMRLVTILLALALGLGALGFGDSAQARSAKAASAGVTLTIAPANSGVLHPGEDLVLSGTLSNGTSADLPAGTASVYLDRSPAASRAQLSGWLSTSPDADDSHATTQVFQAPSPAVPAGEARTVFVTVPAASLGLDPDPAAWGSRAIGVRVAAGSSEIAADNSSIVWFPGAAVVPTRLSLIVPIAAPPSTSGLISSDDLATFTGPDGVLTRELDQAVDRRVALAIDPMVIASIRILGTSAPASARDWLLRLKNVTNDTFALSYADADLAVMSQSNRATILTPTDFAIDPKRFPGAPPTPTSTPSSPSTPNPGATTPPTEPVLPTSKTILDWKYTVPSIAWPLDDSVVQKDLGVFEQNGLKTTILASGNVSPSPDDQTLNAARTVDGHPALVADATISTLFRKAVLASNTIAWQGAMAELSASLAVISRQNATTANTLLATLGRNYPTNAYRLTDTIAALSALPWVAGSTLSDALAVPPSAATIVAAPEKPERVAQADALFVAEQAVDVFSAVLKEPTLLSGQHRLDLLATLSSAWVGNTAGWKNAYDTYATRSAEITNSVKIVESSSIIQPSDKISLPVTVRNDLAFPVEVVITVRSPSGILHVVENRVPLTVEANSQAGARIAVQSVANGDVQLRVSLSSTSGTPISSPSFVDVNVQAQWETAITVGIGALLLGVFGFGIWRNIAKRRRAKRAGTDDETDGDAEIETEAETETGRD